MHATITLMTEFGFIINFEKKWFYHLDKSYAANVQRDILGSENRLDDMLTLDERFMRCSNCGQRSMQPFEGRRYCMRVVLSTRSEWDEESFMFMKKNALDIQTGPLHGTVLVKHSKKHAIKPHYGTLQIFKSISISISMFSFQLRQYPFHKVRHMY